MIPKALVSDDVRQVLLSDGWHKVRGRSFFVQRFKIWNGDGKEYIEPGGWSARWIERTAQGNNALMTVPLASILGYQSGRRNPDDMVVPLPDQYDFWRTGVIDD